VSTTNILVCPASAITLRLSDWINYTFLSIILDIILAIILAIIAQPYGMVAIVYVIICLTPALFTKVVTNVSIFLALTKISQAGYNCDMDVR
jgi:hypothetical protein